MLCVCARSWSPKLAIRAISSPCMEWATGFCRKPLLIAKRFDGCDGGGGFGRVQRCDQADEDGGCSDPNCVFPTRVEGYVAERVHIFVQAQPAIAIGENRQGIAE